MNFSQRRIGKNDAAGYGGALVFFGRSYFIRVPFFNGEPKRVGRWILQLKTAAAWKSFLRENHIGYVLRAPDYPPQICGPLQELETAGALEPAAHRDVSVLEGYRLKGTRRTITATMLRVREDDWR